MPPRVDRLAALLTQADICRKASQWADASQLYCQALELQPNQPGPLHNLALCQLALGQLQESVITAREALQYAPQQWQTHLVLAKTWVKLGQKEQAIRLLAQLLQRFPQVPQIRLEYATLNLQYMGRAAMARELVAPLLADPAVGVDAKTAALVSQLYDRDPGLSPQNVNQAFLDFGRQHMRPPLEVLPPSFQLPVVMGRRPRVGVISIQLQASPVYYFTIGALPHMARDVDLVFFHRGQRSDWATEAFRQIATDWVDVSSCNEGQLAAVLRASRLHSLLELSGWMDPVGLHALAGKPVPRMFKWVGGQSNTTGLSTFDGFVSDPWQTPEGSDPLYSEPLLRLDCGYVTYSPPAWMPEPRVRPDGTVHLGVIANPAKLSRAFLQDLNRRCLAWQEEASAPFDLSFIDARYHQPDLRQRVADALTALEPRFVAPKDQAGYFNAVADLDAIIDTWPYSGGLTTVEGYCLGVPTLTREGTLFCERHTLAHAHYAKVPVSLTYLDRVISLKKLKRTIAKGYAVRRETKHHQLLARQLLGHIV
jgi:protein O-GlcNAc transferase